MVLEGALFVGEADIGHKENIVVAGWEAAQEVLDKEIVTKLLAEDVRGEPLHELARGLSPARVLCVLEVAVQLCLGQEEECAQGVFEGVCEMKDAGAFAVGQGVTL